MDLALPLPNYEETDNTEPRPRALPVLTATALNTRAFPEQAALMGPGEGTLEATLPGGDSSTHGSLDELEENEEEKEEEGLRSDNTPFDAGDKPGICRPDDKQKKGGYLADDYTVFCANKDYIPYQQQREALCGVIYRDLDDAKAAMAPCNPLNSDVQVFSCVAVHRAYHDSEADYLQCLLEHGATLTNKTAGTEGNIDAAFCLPGLFDLAPSGEIIGDNYAVIVSVLIAGVAGFVGMALVIRAAARPFEEAASFRIKKERGTLHAN